MEESTSFAFDWFIAADVLISALDKSAFPCDNALELWANCANAACSFCCPAFCEPAFLMDSAWTYITFFCAWRYAIVSFSCPSSLFACNCWIALFNPSAELSSPRAIFSALALPSAPPANCATCCNFSLNCALESFNCCDFPEICSTVSANWP